MHRSNDFSYRLVFAPLFFGLAFGVLVSRGDWHYALALAILPPLVILFFSRPFIGVIIWLLLNPFISALPNPDLLYWMFHRILIPMTLCMGLVTRLFEKGARSSARLAIPEWVVLMLAGFVPITILLYQVNYRLPLIHYLDRMLIPFLMYLTVRLKPVEKRDFQLLEWAAVFIALSQSFIGLFSWLLPGFLPDAWRPSYGVRVSGTLSNPNVYALVLVFSAVLVFQFAMNRRPGIIRTGFLLACGLSLLCVFLSMERAAWLSTAIVLLGLVFLYPKPVAMYLAIGALFIVIAGAGLLSEKIAQASQRIYSQRPVDDRIVVSDAMLQMIMKKPVFGWGYDTLDQHIQSFYRQVGSSTPPRLKVTSHNTCLTILTETGMVGFLGYIFPVLYWLAYSFRTRQSLLKNGLHNRPLLAAFCLAFLMCFCINNFFDMRFFPYALTLYWMIIGFIGNLLCLSQNCSNPVRRIKSLAQ